MLQHDIHSDSDSVTAPESISLFQKTKDISFLLNITFVFLNNNNQGTKTKNDEDKKSCDDDVLCHIAHVVQKRGLKTGVSLVVSWWRHVKKVGTLHVVQFCAKKENQVLSLALNKKIYKRVISACVFLFYFSLFCVTIAHI